VTFDSGGLSLKPSDSMLTMKCDMAGGGCSPLLAATIAALKLPIHFIAAIGLVENMTGPAAYKLGDVITARQRYDDRSPQHRRRGPGGFG